MNLFHKSFLFYIILAMSLSNTIQAKDNNQNVILILDASGSMWGQIDGTAKIDIARSSISKLLNGWNVNTKMGVMVYGHRVKGDCNDIQVLMPLSIVKKSSIMGLLNDLNPKGKTPLASSIIKAANILKSKENAATVILVSDGLDTCGMDPCAVARQLKKDNINFKAHVIGFGLSGIDDSSKLSCIAKATGGKYYTANNSEQLNKAFIVLKKVVTRNTIKIKASNSKNSIVISSTDSGGRWNPPSCDAMRTMHITKQVIIDSIKSCTRLVIKSGGELMYDVSSSGETAVVIVESGGKLFLKNNIYAVVNKGGEVKIADGDITIIHAESGTTQISPEAEFKKQSGNAEIELIKNFETFIIK